MKTIGKTGRRTIFAHLQVIAQCDRIGDDIVRPGGKVHVTYGTTREHKARQHLGQVIGGDTVSITGVKYGALQKGDQKPV